MDPRTAGSAGPGERASAARPELSNQDAGGRPPRRLGVSFSPGRARHAGLDWRPAFKRVLGLGLDPIRLSAFWDDVDSNGYDDLDWLVSEAARAGPELILTVGMKAQGWPEFYIPGRLQPAAATRSDVAAASADLRRQTVEFVAATVERYRRQAEIAVWQVENEPLNPSGPRRWWIGPEFVAEEIATVRALDPRRPIALNVFSRFNTWLDAASIRHGMDPGRLLGSDARRPEAEALTLLRRDDVLGLDVYRRIGYRRFGRRGLTRSRHWKSNAARWAARAAAEGKRAWVLEAQAEPWEPQPPHGHRQGSCRPDDVADTVEGLWEAGCSTVLLWGVEHWLARDAAGDGSWLAAVGQAAGALAWRG
ncbi:MAG TPA: hypothetical protein VKI99_11960 [Candidatus Dormibacteraeota bacterium]|nr:hypothetical protein [Candidatus Dormibacteraeota bacterium]